MMVYRARSVASTVPENDNDRTHADGNDEDDEECLLPPNTVALDLAELKHVIALSQTRGVPGAAQHGSP